ncbi:zinc finger domain-containing protein [Streptomyces sp. NPDC002845]
MLVIAHPVDNERVACVARLPSEGGGSFNIVATQSLPQKFTQGGDAAPGRGPHCRAEAGQRCRRPSGHTADGRHADRIKTAEAIDQQRDEANARTLLAPWPT